MARLFDDGSDEYLRGTGASFWPGSPSPLTVVCWFKTDVNNAYQWLLGGTRAAGSRYAGIYLGNTAKVGYVDHSGSGVSVHTTTTFAVNTWHHACGVRVSQASRAVYLDGGGKNTDARTKWVSGLDETTVGTRILYPGAPDWFMSGMIAELAMWNVVLTDAEVAVLAARFSPLFVRPSNLICYWPVGGIYGRHDKDIVGGYDLTAYNTPSWADHPPIIYPAPVLVSPAAAAAYTVPLAHILEMSA